MRRLLPLVIAPLVAAVVGLSLLPAPSYAGGAARLERRLADLRCDVGRVDGRLDRHARSAIMRFQSRVGLSATGKVSDPTRRRLLDDRAPRCDRRPVPAHSGAGRRVVVSQRQNWVWLVGARGVVAQAGMIDNPDVLRPGAHATGSYCGRPARVWRNQDLGGRLWLDRFVRFAPCGIGFHRIPIWKSSGAQLHPDWYLGTNLAQSHGCLRVSRAFSEKVWRFTARRTPVRVV